MFPSDLENPHCHAISNQKIHDMSLKSQEFLKFPEILLDFPIYFPIKLWRTLQVVASTSCGIPMATRWAPAPVAAASPTRHGRHRGSPGVKIRFFFWAQKDGESIGIFFHTILGWWWRRLSDMYLYLYICMFIYVYIYISIYLSIYIYIYTSLSLSLSVFPVLVIVMSIVIQ